MGSRLNRGFPFFVRADANGLFDVGYKYLAVADLLRLRGLDDCGHGSIQMLVADDEFKLHLRQKIHGVFAAAIDLRMAFLAAEAFDYADRHSFDSHLVQGVFDFFQLERFDDGFDLFHFAFGSMRPVAVAGIPSPPVWVETLNTATRDGTLFALS